MSGVWLYRLLPLGFLKKWLMGGHSPCVWAESVACVPVRAGSSLPRLLCAFCRLELLSYNLCRAVRILFFLMAEGAQDFFYPFDIQSQLFLE